MLPTYSTIFCIDNTKFYCANASWMFSQMLAYSFGSPATCSNETKKLLSLPALRISTLNLMVPGLIMELESASAANVCELRLSKEMFCDFMIRCKSSTISPNGLVQGKDKLRLFREKVGSFSVSFSDLEKKTENQLFFGLDPIIGEDDGVSNFILWNLCDAPTIEIGDVVELVLLFALISMGGDWIGIGAVGKLVLLLLVFVLCTGGKVETACIASCGGAGALLTLFLSAAEFFGSADFSLRTLKS